MFRNYKKLLNPFRKDTKIKYQLIVYISCSFLIVLAGFVFVTDSFFSQLTSEIKNEANERLVQKIETDIKYSLLMMDYDKVSKIMDEELVSGNIDLMVVSYSISPAKDDTGVIAKRISIDNKKIIPIPIKELDRLNYDKNFYSQTLLSDSIGNVFGKVEIVLNKSNVQNVVKLSKFLIIFILVINFAICLVTTIVILNKVLVGRLLNLQDALSSIISKNEGHNGFLEIEEEDELGEIKKLINDIHAKMLSIINEKKNINDKLAVQIKEIELLQKQIIQAEKIAGLGAIVGGVAHELNSPLSAVNVISETISENMSIFKEHLTSDKFKLSDVASFIDNIEEGLKMLHGSNSKALKLIHEFKSAVSSQTDEQIVKINLTKFTKELMNLVKTTYPVTNITVKIEVDESANEIETMRGCLFRVMTGLVSNVYVHAFPNSARGSMIISVKEIDNSLIEISVQDNGIGIPEDNLGKVFDPFFTTSLNNKNQGLGLHLALTETINNLKGVLAVASEEGKGAVFTLILPKKLVKTKS